MSNKKQHLQAAQQEITLAIEDLTDEGAGIGRHEGKVIFVPGTIPGDVVRIQLLQDRGSYGIGRLNQIESASEHRIDPPCPYAGPCGGCSLQHMDYDAQLYYKQKQVVDALERIGGFSDVPIQPIVGMTFPYHYRNKGVYPFGYIKGSQSEVALGFYRTGTHQLVPIEACMIQHGDSGAILKVVRDWANRHKITVYEPQRHTGLLRHLFVRTNYLGEHMVGLVVNGMAIPHADTLLASLLAAVPRVISLQINPQTKRGTTILGDEFKVLYGTKTMIDRIGDLEFELAMPSFFQVNPEQTRTLYQIALDYAALTGKETVWDIYSGAGTITLSMAQKAKAVFGNEINRMAVENAIENAKRNGILGASFVEGPAEVVVPKWLEDHQRPEVVVLDPPRKGAEPAVLDAILKMNPDRIVYVSCKPSTLARDLKHLAASGYQLTAVTPVDMFAHSGHCEMVVKLERSVSIEKQ